MSPFFVWWQYDMLTKAISTKHSPFIEHSVDSSKVSRTNRGETGCNVSMRLLTLHQAQSQQRLARGLPLSRK